MNRARDGVFAILGHLNTALAGALEHRFTSRAITVRFARSEAEFARLVAAPGGLVAVGGSQDAQRDGLAWGGSPTTGYPHRAGRSVQLDGAGAPRAPPRPQGLRRMAGRDRRGLRQRAAELLGQRPTLGVTGCPFFPDRHPEPRDAALDRLRRPGRCQPVHGPHHRGDRHRQGTVRRSGRSPSTSASLLRPTRHWSDWWPKNASVPISSSASTAPSSRSPRCAGASTMCCSCSGIS